MAKHRVLIADDLSQRAVEILSAHPDIAVEVKMGLKGPELIAALDGVSGLAVRSATKVTAQVLDGVTSLKIIGRAGVGVDNIDVSAASRRGVIVMNTPGGNAVTTAEHALFLLCALARHIPQATASMKAGKWDKKSFSGTELEDKTLAVLGLGNIGRIVARKALGLGMKVIGFDPGLGREAAQRLGVELVDLDHLWARADAISVHTPLSDDTRGLLGAKTFPKMKRGVLLVNAARGGVIDEKALLEALESGQVGGAALDVFVEEPVPSNFALIQHPRVICTPHLGASTGEAQEKVAVEVAEQLVAFLTRGEIKNAVNAAHIPGDHQTRLLPYVELADKIGKFVGQQISGVEELHVELSEEVAELAEHARKIVPNAVLAGLLGATSDIPVNQVNAPMLAVERGVKATMSTREGGENFVHSIRVRVTAKGMHQSVEGAVFTQAGRIEARIVRVGPFFVDVVPEGHILVLTNDDQPGVIGAIGTLLGRRGVNVSRMQVGLDQREALQLWNLDAALDADTLAELRRTPAVRSASVVRL